MAQALPVKVACIYTGSGAKARAFASSGVQIWTLFETKQYQ